MTRLLFTGAQDNADGNLQRWLRGRADSAQNHGPDGSIATLAVPHRPQKTCRFGGEAQQR